MEKYGSMEAGWTTKVPIGLHGVGLWKFIRFKWDKFFRMLKFEVGNRSHIRFWGDVWCVGEPLKEAFRDLYHIARVKDATVTDSIHFRDDFVHWEVNFTQRVQDWELESISSFQELLYSIIIKGDEEDKMYWKPTPNKGFQVKSYYRELSSRGVGCFPWKSI